MRMFVFGMREHDELPFFQKYAEKYDIEFEYTTEYPKPENYHMADGFDAVSIITTPTPAEMIDVLKEGGVKVISTRTIGYDHMDIAHAKKIGMGVCNVTYSPEAVADYTIMLMLISCRKIPYVMAKAEVQDFTLEGKLGKELSKSTVGIIGTGRIGTTLIKHLSGFGCKMLAYDVYENEEAKKYATYVDLDTLYRESEIISLHAPALEGTYHMMNAEAFDKMKDGVIIVNCARGSLIDTQAMIENLTNGKIGFAALDVIENELGIYYKDLSGTIIDNPDMDRLKSFYNVFFSPHMAFYTDEAVSDMVENSIVGALAYLKGEDHPFIIK